MNHKEWHYKQAWCAAQAQEQLCMWHLSCNIDNEYSVYGIFPSCQAARVIVKIHDSYENKEEDLYFTPNNGMIMTMVKAMLKQRDHSTTSIVDQDQKLIFSNFTKFLLFQMQTQETNTQTALLSKCVKTSHNTLTSL